jgi:hypothetical protein
MRPKVKFKNNQLIYMLFLFIRYLKTSFLAFIWLKIQSALICKKINKLPNKVP